MDEEPDSDRITIVGLCLFVVPLIALLVAGTLGSPDDAASIEELSLLSIALGAVVIGLLIGVPLVAGQNRTRMSLMIGPSLRVIMLFLAGSVLTQGVLLIYSLFVVETSLTNMIPIPRSLSAWKHWESALSH